MWSRVTAQTDISFSPHSEPVAKAEQVRGCLQNGPFCFLQGTVRLRCWL